MLDTKENRTETSIAFWQNTGGSMSGPYLPVPLFQTHKDSGYYSTVRIWASSGPEVVPPPAFKGHLALYASHSVGALWSARWCQTDTHRVTAVYKCTLLETITGFSFDSLEGLHTTSEEDMLDANVSKTLRQINCTNNSSCGYASVGFPITMMITGMVGNSLALILVCISYRKKENKRKRSFLLCIGSLALTDLFGQLLTSPIVISVYQSGRNLSDIDQSGKLCAFFGVCMTTFGLCALFMASAMAIERALAITNPHWYSNHMKTSVTKQILAVIWGLVLLFALLPVAGVGEYTQQWPGTWCFISMVDAKVPGNGFFSTTFAILGISALLITVFCNVVTIRGVVTRCKTKPGTSQSSKQWERLTTETVIQLLGIMCVLLICWSPLLVCFSRASAGYIFSYSVLA